jgi:NAD(P)-dependent dehydrogenase (short-subunit alcohol dehydrogenase family)
MALAQMFAEAAAYAFICDDPEGEGPASADHLSGKVPLGSFYCLDVTREEDWQGLVARAAAGSEGKNVLAMTSSP